MALPSMERRAERLVRECAWFRRVVRALVPLASGFDYPPRTSPGRTQQEGRSAGFGLALVQSTGVNRITETRIECRCEKTMQWK